MHLSLSMSMDARIRGYKSLLVNVVGQFFLNRMLNIPCLIPQLKLNWFVLLMLSTGCFPFKILYVNVEYLFILASKYLKTTNPALKSQEGHAGKRKFFRLRYHLLKELLSDGQSVLHKTCWRICWQSQSEVNALDICVQPSLIWFNKSRGCVAQGSYSASIFILLYYIAYCSIALFYWIWCTWMRRILSWILSPSCCRANHTIVII
jgi:hypothetical protein